MAVTKQTVEYVANLARIELQTKELDKLAHQLKDIIDFIGKLNEVDIKDILPTSHILPIKNVLREDVPRESLVSEKVLKNAPLKEANFFVVPKVIE